MTNDLCYNQERGVIIIDGLTYTTSMIQEIKELLSSTRQRIAVQVNT